MDTFRESDPARKLLPVFAGADPDLSYRLFIRADFQNTRSASPAGDTKGCDLMKVKVFEAHFRTVSHILPLSFSTAPGITASALA